MANDFKDAPNTFPWPPVLYGVAILLGAISSWLLPTPWLPSPASDMLVAVGVLLIAAALFIDYRAMRTLAAAETTIMPNRASAHLVTSGPFSFTRNPIYLANTMITIGAGLAFGIVWFLPLAIIAAVATQQMAILREERHLEARFGKAFREYGKKVRRWI